ncbi:hypothetical protein V8E53_004407 [Lactarius tabidus]
MSPILLPVASQASQLHAPSFSHLTLIGLVSPTFVLKSRHRLTLSFRVPPLSCCLSWDQVALGFGHLLFPFLSPHASLTHPPFPLSSCLPHSAPAPYPRLVCSPLSSRVPSLVLSWSLGSIHTSLPSGRRWYSVYLFFTSPRWSPSGFWHSMVPGHAPFLGESETLAAFVHEMTDKADSTLALVNEGPASEYSDPPSVPFYLSISDTNVILRSSNEVDKLVDSLPVVQLSEDASLLSNLISLLYRPQHPVKPGSYEKRCSLLAACQKYDMLLTQQEIRDKVNLGTYTK